MKIVDHEEFLSMPEGTVFSYGPKFCFNNLLIKEQSIIDPQGRFWGFFACDPCGIESADCGELQDREFDMFENGTSYPMDECVSKYMSYDGDCMDCFLVFEEADVKRLKEIMGNGSW